MRAERRKTPRFLCSDEFSNSLLSIDGQDYELVSVNFNRFGLASYTHERMPELDKKAQYRVSFQYLTKDVSVEINDLSCRIANCHETDVGHQYGIQFLYDKQKQVSLLDSLRAIESSLEAQSNSEDRYKLFD